MKKILYLTVFLFPGICFSQTWSAVGSGTDDGIFCQAVYNGNLFVGGEFTSAGSIPCRIGFWNGNAWDSMPGAWPGDNLSALEEYNGELYVGFASSIFNGQTANGIIKWNGSTWSNVSSGVNNVPVDFVVFNNELYAGGLFTIAGGIVCNHIAKWNGTSWSSVGTGFDDDVLALAVYNNELYAAGRFDTAGAFNLTHKISKWNGNSWQPLGSGISGGTVYSLEVYNNELYVGGDFLTAGGITVNGIARWNGTSWNSVSSGVLDYGVSDLCVYNNELYACGLFTSAGGVPANNIARWDGQNWSPLGAGIDSANGYASVLTVYNDDLYVGGNFNMAGNLVANNIARWTINPGIDEADLLNSIHIKPNPFTSEFTISGTNENALVFIYDVTGKNILTTKCRGSETKISAGYFTCGYYFLTYVDGNKISRHKLIRS